MIGVDVRLPGVATGESLGWMDHLPRLLVVPARAAWYLGLHHDRSTAKQPLASSPPRRPRVYCVDFGVKPKLIILDIDETLLHSSRRGLRTVHDFLLGNYYVYLRPDVRLLLEFCRRRFRVAVWTSSSRRYALGAMHRLLTPDYPLEFLWSRRRCVEVTREDTRRVEHIKDLRDVETLGYDLGQILFVDDTPRKLQRQPENLVPIRPFLGSPEDQELGRLMDFLAELEHASDVRDVDKRRWWQAQEVPI